MSDARWPQVKALFEAAIDRPADERAAFIAAATGEDETLRREVEALLAADSAGVGLTNRLPVHLSTLTTRADEGIERLGPYRVGALLGAGGMGEVFRAHDSKLNREVALKLLPAAFELDPARIAGFQRVALALAALNNPHIAAIYGF